MTKSLVILLSVLCSIQLASAQYNPADAFEFAAASALAYCDPSSIQSWTCGAACQNLTGYQPFYSNVFQVSEGQTLSFTMIVNPSTQRFVTSFRGTFTSWQLILELLEGGATDYTLQSVPDAIADYYFYNHYTSSLRATFVQNLQSAYSSYPNYEFVFTGHSLGAAITTLAAFDAINSGIIPGQQVIMYNYGSPRVGNIVLAQAIEAAIPQIYRVVHYQDIVPHVPPCVRSLVNGECVSSTGDSLLSKIPLLWHAWHVAEQIFYNEANTSYQVCGEEDINCMDQFTALTGVVSDHFFYAGVHMQCDGNMAIMSS
jgi:hypothetical protein